MSHQVIRRLIPLATLLGLLLSRTAMAQEPKVIVKARTVGNPVVMAILQDDHGQQREFENAEAVRHLIDGTDWVLAEDGLRITRNGRPVLRTGFVQLGPRFFWFHLREGKSLVDGTLVHPTATKDGFSELCWTVFSEDGRSSVSVFVSVQLSFVP
jgi:hypothetical protein